MKTLIFGKSAFMILVLFINVCIIQQCGGQESTSSASSVGYLTLQVSGEEKTVRHQNTNVNVTKAVIGTGSKLNFKYDIQTPKVDDFHFVLALDSSGSMGYGGNPKQGEAVIYAVPKFLEETVAGYTDKNISISILSWDDDIDFAYSDLNNKDPGNAKLVKIETAQKEMNNSVFNKVDADGYYRCREKDHTNLSKALDASIAILDNNSENYYHRTSKFIILVTGASEYESCSDDLIALANKKGYPIFVIGMDLLDEKSNMFSDLKRLSENKKSRFQNILSIKEDLNEELRIALNEALRNAISEPVAEEVTIVESLYSYIVPQDIAYVKVKGYPEYDSPISVKRNDDYTIAFTLPDGLLADNVTEITFDADLVLGEIPVSANKISKPVIFSPLSNNTRSYVSYNWLRKELVNFDLPDVSVNIQSGVSNNLPVEEGNVENPEEQVKKAGYHFGLLTLLCFCAILSLMRKKI